MKFVEWLKTRHGQWVNVWAKDGESVTGRLYVHEDFAEIVHVEGHHFALPFHAITSVNERTDKDDLTLASITESNRERV